MRFDSILEGLACTLLTNSGGDMFFSRRQFLKTSVGTVAAVAVADKVLDGPSNRHDKRLARAAEVWRLV